MNLISALPSPSMLNFLAGLFAGAGINMLTSVATGPPGNISTAKIALDSVLWVVAAGFLTWAARILETADQGAERRISGLKITEEEKQDIIEEYRKTARRRVELAIVLTLLSVLAAVLLMPGLITWAPIVQLIG